MKVQAEKVNLNVLSKIRPLANGRAGIQTHGFKFPAFLLYVSAKVPEDYRAKSLQYVWRLWEVSLGENEFKLELEEWTVLCPMDAEEIKDPRRRMV